MRRAVERGAQRGEGRVLAVVAVHQPELGREPRQQLGVGRRAVLGQARAHPLDQRVAAGAAAGDADDAFRQPTAPLEAGERWEDLLVGEVAGDAEDDERVARRRA